MEGWECWGVGHLELCGMLVHEAHLNLENGLCSMLGFGAC